MQTNHFKARLISGGVGGYFAEYGHVRMDAELYSSYYYESGNGGDAWSKRKAYIANSPSTK